MRIIKFIIIHVNLCIRYTITISPYNSSTGQSLYVAHMKGSLAHMNGNMALMKGNMALTKAGLEIVPLLQSGTAKKCTGMAAFVISQLQIYLSVLDQKKSES